jgi:serine protease AprX
MARPRILSLGERLDIDPELTGRGVCVAFVDVGFYPHPDLLYPDKRIRAYVDVTKKAPAPGDLLEPRDTSWHGMMTVCAACGSGYVSGGHYRGPASDADVVLLRAAGNDGRIHGKHVAAAIRAPLRYPELGIRVLNVSLGVSPGDPDADDVGRAVSEAVLAGVTVIAASGNDADVAPEQPGAAPDAITVGGTDDKNTRATDDDSLWHSSIGRGKPDLLAPAMSLAAPMLPGSMVAREAKPLFELLGLIEEMTAACRFERSEGEAEALEVDPSLVELERAVVARIDARRYASTDYQHVEGTSFAAPITSAIVAQMLQANPTLTPASIRRALIETAASLEGVPRAAQGAGVLRPREAVAWAKRQSIVRR